MIPVDSKNINQLPDRILQWLNARGLSSEIIKNYGITYDGQKRLIEIPIRDINNEILFHKFRRDPDDTDGPKYTYNKGAHTALFNINSLRMASEIIICEGEFDCLVLESLGFAAVTSTGGALSFQAEWKPLFEGKTVYVCFDNDTAGLNGMLKVCSIMPDTKIVPLPPEVGDHGDITDFFTKLGKSAEDFRFLMSLATAPPHEPEPEEQKPKKKYEMTDDAKENLQKAKAVPLDTFLKFDKRGFAICPFHSEKTPSLKKDKSNRWYCYGCGKGGDTIDLIQSMYDLSMGAAIKKILE